MNFSQEMVQEFQLSSVNFDLSTGISAGGAVNVVTRGGTNDWHGSAYFYFRDHNMAAYPGLKRNPLNPSPFFARRNPGATLGGPLKKDRLFFFLNYEYMNQVQALTIQSTDAAFAPLTGTYGSPYIGKGNPSVRVDSRVSDKHNLFVRFPTMATVVSANRWNSGTLRTGHTTPTGPTRALSDLPAPSSQAS